MWASLLVAAGLLAACGSSEAAEGGGVEAVVTSTTVARASTSTTVAETTTSRALTEEEVVVQTVADMWQMLNRVGAAPDPEHPELAKYLMGEQLEKSKATMAKWQAQGMFTQASPEDRAEHRPELVSLDGAEAVVEDCSIDDGWLMSRDESGTLTLVDGQAGIRLWRLGLTKTAEGWKVHTATAIETWYAGDPGCTADW